MYEASFPEDTSIDSEVLTVGATDVDTGTNAVIQYFMFGAGAEDFSIDVNTGTIKTHSTHCKYHCRSHSDCSASHRRWRCNSH